MAMASAGVIGMTMGDQSPVDTANRINEEIARRAVKPFVDGE
jgi:hypothetical protein